MNETSTDAPFVGYENRVVAFIDLLGFRELVSLSALHSEATQHIHSFLQAIQTHEVAEGIYGTIPTLGLDGTKLLKPARDLPGGAEKYESLKKAWPIEITQFSDSLVLSCNAIDGMSCTLLLEFIVSLSLAAFQQGFLLRGGISQGLLIHQEGGPLFGPAFVDAYAMESKQAAWPRIVVNKNVRDLAVGSENALPNSKPIDLMFSIFDAEEGKLQMTLATAYRYLSKAGRLQFDLEATETKLTSLTQTYASEEKLGKRYHALLNDWKSVIGNHAQEHKG